MWVRSVGGGTVGGVDVERSLERVEGGEGGWRVERVRLCGEGKEKGKGKGKGKGGKGREVDGF